MVRRRIDRYVEEVAGALGAVVGLGRSTAEQLSLATVTSRFGEEFHDMQDSLQAPQARTQVGEKYNGFPRNQK